MATRVVEGKKPYTGGKAISIDENKVISLDLRDENNLIIYDEGDDEIYVDLQLPDGIEPTDAFPVGITTGRVLVADDWDITGTIICAKTTSGDNIKILYGDDGTLWMDNGTGTFKQIYFKADVDAIAQAIWSYIYDNTAKIFHFNGWTESDAQDVYDWISEGKYAIVNCSYGTIPMQNNIFTPTNVTTGVINSLTNQSVTQGIGGTFYESEEGISMTVADGVVTNVSGFGIIINDDGRVIIASSSTPSSYTTGTTWYDTTNKRLMIYDGTSWNLVGGGGGGSGDVVGPASATDGHLAVFDGATGKIIKDGGAVPTIPTNVSDFNNDAGYTPYDSSNPSGYTSNTGDVVGPASSTNGHLAVFDGATGKLIKDGGAVPTVPTNVSDFNNDAGYLTSSTGVTSFNGSTGAITYTAPVSSVNSQTGAVTLDADDISDSTTTNKFVTATDKTTWSGKQDALTLPSTPTSGHLVTWGGDNKTFADGGAVPTEPTVISGDTGVTYTIKVSNSDPASGTASNIITLVL